MCHTNPVPSLKQCEKKLREIKLLKDKERLSNEEKDKVRKEVYYKDVIKQCYRKVLDVIPDEVQFIILSYLDINTRLNMLRLKYTPSFINTRLSLLENNPTTIKKLYSCFKYVRSILNTYLNKDGDTYKKIRCYIEESKYRQISLHTFTKAPNNNKNYYFDMLISIILCGIKNYTRMYKLTDNIDEITKREIEIKKLFIHFSTLPN
jgi:hypothetical protein